MVPLLFALCLPAQADVAIPPPAGKRFLSHAVRIDGLDQHPGFVVVAFDGAPGGKISAHRAFTADAPQQTLARGGSNRGGGMGAPALHLMPQADYEAWDQAQRAIVSAQRDACADRGEGCAHISRFVPSYTAPEKTVACGEPIELKLSGLATGPDTVIDVFSLAEASATTCTLLSADREREKGGESVGRTGCSSAALSGTSLLAGLGLLFGLRRRRGEPS